MTIKNLDNLSHAELIAMSRAHESRMNVLRNRSLQDPQRYGRRFKEVTADHRAITDRLRDMGGTDPVATVPDKEGTAPTLADAHGNFAPDAKVANIGGIGIRDSNTNPERAKAELEATVAGDRERVEQLRGEAVEPEPVEPAPGAVVNPPAPEDIGGEPAATGEDAGDEPTGRSSRRKRS